MFIVSTDSKINSTYVTVFNRYKTREGIEDKINGYAFIPDPREPGRLRVKLDGVPVESPCKSPNFNSNIGGM